MVQGEYMSPIDKIFKEIFGQSPDKAGTAYEKLACIAEHLMSDGVVKHDNKIRGSFSDSLYQIDVLSSCGADNSMGEAKDYTIQNKKVGRGDLQKLGGALPDILEVNKGKFYSATGYTKPAVQYAASSGSFPSGKPIEIYEFRPSTELDEVGTIKTIIIHIKVLIPKPQCGTWIPHFSEKGLDVLRQFFTDSEDGLQVNMMLENLYDSNGGLKLTIRDLTSKNYGSINSDTKSAHASFLLKEHYIYVNGVLAELKGLEYTIPFSELNNKLEITDDSNLRFVLKNSDGEVIRFITDETLRNYSFDSAGNVIAP